MLSPAKPNQITPVNEENITIISHNNKKKEKLVPYDKNLIPLLIEMKSLFKNNCNGWVALAIWKGVDVVSEKMTNSIATISIICGLFLSASLPLLLNPASNIIELDNFNFNKIGYLLSMSISMICHFCSLLTACLLVKNNIKKKKNL